MTPLASDRTDLDFARFAGEIAEEFHFNRSVGQIYGLLYIAQGPLSLDDIGRRLSMSKGNASINVRTLESWGAVRPVSVAGSRRDFYEANRNLRTLAVQRLRDGLTKRLDRAEERLAGLAAAANGSSSGKRLAEVRALLARGRRVLGLLGKWLG